MGNEPKFLQKIVQMGRIFASGQKSEVITTEPANA